MQVLYMIWYDVYIRCNIKNIRIVRLVSLKIRFAKKAQNVVEKRKIVSSNMI